MEKATKQQTKAHNSRLILKTIYEQGAISRADIARATKLTRPTVSTLVAQLLNDNLIEEAGIAPAQAKGGKPPTLLILNEKAHQILCLDIGNQHYHGALVNLRGERTTRMTLDADGVTGEDALTLVYTLIDALLTKAHTTILGIGLGTPGFIDAEQGIVRQAVNLKWQNLPLRDLLRERYEIPIYLTNDSHAAALGEYVFGQHGESTNLILIKIGQGVGAGIVVDNALFYGDGLGAGEIGQVIVAEQDEHLLTLESVASTRAILSAARQATNSKLSWDGFIAQLPQSADLQQIVAYAGHCLGVAIANLIAAYNIHTIVLSGAILQIGDRLFESINATTQRYALSEMTASTDIIGSGLGDDVVLLGCSALVLKHELGIL